MNYTTLVRSLQEVLSLLDASRSTKAPPFFIPFAPVGYLGLGD